MDITQVIAQIPTMNLGNEIAAAVMSLSMDHIETAGQGMIKMMETSVNPNLGGTIDISI